MQTVRIELGERSYDVLIGFSTLPGLGAAMAERGLAGRNVAVVTSPRIGSIYYDDLVKALGEAEPETTARYDIPDGEDHKTLDYFCRTVGWLARFADNPASKPVVIALGGGVVGDLAGFAAASYRRGVPYVQVPTTLLAAVDSSVGGKTAVNMSEGKNLCGAFHQPRLVYVDLATLSTLDPREVRSGLSEVIKYGAILDEDLFGYIEETARVLVKLDPEALMRVVSRCVELKAQIVRNDERESGERVSLNFGHTLGHCIEKAAAGRYTHGASVAIGMVAAARISQELGLCDETVVGRICTVLATVGLPTAARNLALENVMSYLAHDKKFVTGRNRFVLLEGIGRWTEREGVPEDVVRQAARSVLV